MTPDTVAGLTDALVALFDPLVQAIEDTDSAAALLTDLGYQAPSGIQFLNDFSPPLSALIALADQADDLLRGDTEPDYLALFRSLIDATRDIIKLVRDIGTTLQTSFPADFLAATGIAAQFPRQLADYLLVRMIERQYPVLHSSLLVAGIIDEGEVTTAATSFHSPYMKRVVRWEKLTDYLGTPLTSMQAAYGWGTDAFDYDGLISNLLRFGQSTGLFCSTANPKPGTLQALNSGTDVVTEDNTDSLAILKFPLLPIPAAPVGLEVYPVLTPAKDKAVGLGLGLYFDPSGGLNYPITDALSLGIKYTGTGPLDAGVVILRGQPLQLVSNIFGGSVPQADLSTFIPEFTYTNTGQKTLLFDTSFGAKLEFASWALRAGVLPALSGVYIETDIKGATITIAAGQGGGFLQEILPAEPMALDFDLTLGFSSKTGLYFGGSLDLNVTLPAQIQIGPLAVQAITVSLQPANGKIPLAVGADISLHIGPLGVIVQNVGVTAVLSLPADRDGNAGPMQVDLNFLPPDGAGLSIDSAGLTGGGFLKYDAPAEQYGGVLQLQFTDLSLQAFGLITTQVAGTTGYSLLALIDANFPPVALGWGFTLNGVGGLVAVNRSASVDALRAAIKADRLSSVLFPRDAIANAPQILAELDSLFPTAHGRFLFGPMALIGWGTPTVLTAAIAVILELPEPIRILLLARLAVRAPTESNALVRINMDALGVLDLSKNELSLDAVLFDSRLITYTLSGSMALRATWAAQREFLLAIGGFHPRFTPPPSFPALQRITIDMPGGIVSKLRLAAYLAITSNTVQLGADLDVFIGVSGFGLSGHLGFDALLQLAPFHFEADISGKVALTAGGDDLMSVGLDASLSGPAPWHIAGSFKIHIIFFDVHKSFSHSWGEEAPAVAAATVDVLQLLQATLADPRSWDAQMPDGVAALTPLRQIQDAASVLAHPLALPEVHERVVPLGLAITRFGEAAPAGASRFDITDWRLGGTAPPRATIDDDFAAAQFFDLSDEEKLAQPSFERHTAGVQMDAGLVTSGPAATKTILFDTSFIDEPGGEPRHDPGVPVTPPLFGDLVVILEIGSAGRWSISRAGYRKYNSPGNPIRVAEPRFAVVDGDSLVSAGVGPSRGSTYSDAAALLAGATSRAPDRRGTLGIVATHEMAT